MQMEGNQKGFFLLSETICVVFVCLELVKQLEIQKCWPRHYEHMVFKQLYLGGPSETGTAGKGKALVESWYLPKWGVNLTWFPHLQRQCRGFTLAPPREGATGFFTLTSLPTELQGSHRSTSVLLLPIRMGKGLFFAFSVPLPEMKINMDTGIAVLWLPKNNPTDRENSFLLSSQTILSITSRKFWWQGSSKGGTKETTVREPKKGE